MHLPPLLQNGIEELFENAKATVIRQARASLTQDYKEGKVSPFMDEAKTLAYLGARMPATFAAVYKVLQEQPLEGHILDLGAGPATASWAALSLFPDLEKITLIEQSPHAISLGQQLMKNHPSFHKTTWLKKKLIPPFPKADSAILSYVLGEIKERKDLLSHIFESVETLIIIEPGTPRGFEHILEAREHLLSLNGHILAPCPHHRPCPIQKPDWCHFRARVERTRLHKLLKEGSLGYEDEKFSYLVVSKNPKEPAEGRIIRRPSYGKGHVRLSICSKEGNLVEKTVSQKDKELYRKCKKLDWGDPFM